MKTYPVGRDLKTIFNKGNAPTDDDDGQQRPVFGQTGITHLEMTIPCQCHKYVGNKQKNYSKDKFIHADSNI